MNNQRPYFYPFVSFLDNEQNNNYEKIINKIDNLEKTIKILETKIIKLEKKNSNEDNSDEPTDMYMI